MSSIERRAPSFRRPVSLVILVALAVICVTSATTHAKPAKDPRLARVEQQIENGDAEGALTELRQMLKKNPADAEALLLRSTARIMLGDTEAGFADLEQALAVDPTLRQGWLNLAGMEIAEGRLGNAYDALVKAQELDPTDVDNHLNLGAVVVLEGNLELARRHFDDYLAAHPGAAEAFYLVASNYALGGFDEEAVAHLEKAVQLDEHMRLRARSDDRFLTVDSDAYRKLLGTDSYTPPSDAHTAQAAFKVPYRRNDPKLVFATLEALKQHGLEYDPSVEATENWALAWGELRVKIFTQQNGTGVVSFTAPAERYSDDEWQSLTQRVFRTIYEILERDEKRFG